MRNITASSSRLRRAVQSWPYVFVAVSVTGLAYMAFRALY
jgi:hypothetical protein